MHQCCHDKPKCEEFLSRECQNYIFGITAGQVSRMYATGDSSRNNLASRIQGLSMSDQKATLGNQPSGSSPGQIPVSYPNFYSTMSTSSDTTGSYALSDSNQNILSAIDHSHFQSNVVDTRFHGDTYSGFHLATSAGSGNIVPASGAGMTGTVAMGTAPHTGGSYYGGEGGVLRHTQGSSHGRSESESGLYHRSTVSVNVSGCAPQTAPAVSSNLDTFQGNYMNEPRTHLSERDSLSERFPYSGVGETRYDPTRNLFYNTQNYELNVNYRHSHSSGLPDEASGAVPVPLAPIRHVARANCEPVPPYSVHQGFWGVNPSQGAQVPPNGRAYTSVNLMLRPPSSEPQAPIDISNTGTGLTYSTSSVNPNQGFQSYLQISIGRGGGTISAARTKIPSSHSPASMAMKYGRETGSPWVFQQPTPGSTPQSVPRSLASQPAQSWLLSSYQPQVLVPEHLPRRPSLPDTSFQPSLFEVEDPEQARVPQVPIQPTVFPASTRSSLVTQPSNQKPRKETREDQPNHLAYAQALVLHQLDQKMKLEVELKKEKEKLTKLKGEVRVMEEDLYQRRLRLRNNSILPAREELQQLRDVIWKLRVECECMAKEVDLYHHGQVPLGETNEEFYDHINTGQQGLVLPPEPSTGPSHTPRSNFVDPGGGSQPQVQNQGEEEANEGPVWECSACTFHNHPALDKCEQCEMPRIMLGSDT